MTQTFQYFVLVYSTFKWIIFVVEVSESVNKIFKEQFFRLVAILKSNNKIFEKQLRRNLAKT